MATCNTMTKDPMSGVITHLMTNIKECDDKVLAQSKIITELMLEGPYVDWNRFDIKKKKFHIRFCQGCAKHSERHQYLWQ